MNKGVNTTRSTKAKANGSKNGKMQKERKPEHQLDANGNTTQDLVGNTKQN